MYYFVHIYLNLIVLEWNEQHRKGSDQTTTEEQATSIMCGRAAQTRRCVHMAAQTLGLESAGGSKDANRTDRPSSNDASVQPASSLPSPSSAHYEYAWSDNYNLSPGMDAMVFYKGEDGMICMDRKVWGLVTKRGTKAHPLPPGMGKHFEGLMFNARSDTLYQKPTFGRLAGMKRSCVVALDGYFEWKTDVGGGKSKKQPYFVKRATKDDCQKPFLLMAGLWNQVPTGIDHSPLLDTFTIITTEVCEPISWLHSRMPVCIWDETAALEWITNPTEKLHNEITKSAQQTPKDALDAYPVTKEMSSTKFRSADAIKRLQKEKTVKDFFLAMNAAAQKSPSSDKGKAQSMGKKTKANSASTTNVAPAKSALKRQATPEISMQSPSKKRKTATASSLKHHSRIDFFFQPKK